MLTFTPVLSRQLALVPMRCDSAAVLDSVLQGVILVLLMRLLDALAPALARGVAARDAPPDVNAPVELETPP